METTTAIRVQMGSVDAFIAEMQARPPNVDGLVRSYLRCRSGGHHPIQSVHVGATYLRNDGVVQVVMVEQYAGENWGAGFVETERTQVNIDRIQAAIRTAAEALGAINAGGAHELAGGR